MADKFVVAYDGSPSSKRALQFAVDEASHLGASIVLVHVLEWLPYSFLTVEELEERHKRRTEEMDRAHNGILKPVVSSLEESGVSIEALVRYGQVSSTLVDIIKEKKAAQLFIGKTGQTHLSALVFGSVASSMAQVTTVPCTIVP